MYENAVCSVNEILSIFSAGVRHCLLCAQMQTGKTVVFMTLAMEMLRKNQVKNVIVCSGNRETNLSVQMSPDGVQMQDFKKRYLEYLMQKHAMEMQLLQSKGIDLELYIDMLSENVKIVWGSEMVKKAAHVPKENTLFVLDESHVAQTVTQTPDIFFAKLGVPLNGNIAVRFFFVCIFFGCHFLMFAFFHCSC